MINIVGILGFISGFATCLIINGISLKASDFGTYKLELMPVGSIIYRLDDGFLVTRPSGLSVEVNDRKEIIPFLTGVNE